MTRIQNILVGVDLHHGDRQASSELSAESKAAVDEALRLAAVWDATITFCSVLELSAQSQSLIEHDYQNIFKTVEDVAKSVLSGLVEQCNSIGIPAESVVRIGTAWDELSKESTAGRYDLAIVGTRSKSRVTLFGNTAQKLMRSSFCPVWVVKPSELREIREIAIATDLTPASMPAFHLAVTVARALTARLYVLHAVDFAEYRYLVMAGVSEIDLAQTESQLRQTADESLREQLHQTDFRTLTHGVKIELLNGQADAAIPEFVAANGIDLLVMGTHGYSGLSRLLLGNTAERILSRLHASLLSVRPPDNESAN